jgi:hypothetical protein
MELTVRSFAENFELNDFVLGSLLAGHDGVTRSLSGVTGFLPRLLMVARTLSNIS